MPNQSPIMGDNRLGNSGPVVGEVDALQICPKPDNEPPITCRLYSDAPHFVELCGWTCMTPLDLSCVIRSSTKFHDTREPAQKLMENCITLSEMQNLIGRPGQCSKSVYVHIVAKKRVDAIVIGGKILIIPLVVIADSSGYCLLCSMNEGFVTIYSELKVGDCLLLTSCTPQLPKNSYHHGLFAENMCLNLELKVHGFHVRNYHRKKLSLDKLSEFKFPKELFDDSSKVKLPSEVENEFLQMSPVPNTTSQPASEHEQYYDLVGVVSYVGRIERCWIQETTEVQCLVNGNIENQRLQRFFLCRWICLIDKTSKKSLPVKVYIGDTEVQTDMVPGAIVILTHCQTKCDEKFSSSYCSTSLFTQIHLGPQIEEYIFVYPAALHVKLQNVISRESYLAIVSRKEIASWTAGGTRTTKICSDEKFRHFFAEWSHRERDLQPLFRRESRRAFFSGLILRVIKVDNENFPVVYYLHKDFKARKSQKQNVYRVVEHHLSYKCFNNSSWYSFVRKLPPLNTKDLKLDKTRQISSKIVQGYKDYCAPLLLPAEVDGKKLPTLAELDRIDGPPYFLLDILSEERKVWYTCVWKPWNYSIDDMRSKVDAAKEKDVICAAEIFCVEKGAPLEVNLHDFIIK